MSSNEISAERYHADPCEAPSLSSSIAQLLVNESPLHAWTAHPRLNPNAVREYSAPMDRGSICHALILEGRTDRVRLIQAKKTEGAGKNKVETDEPVDDFKTVRAREERDAARAEGKFPILQGDWPEVLAMYEAATVQLATFKPALFTEGGEAEKTLVWFEEEFGIWCRARLDWISKDRKDVLDYKTTGSTANPDVVSRTLFTNGYDIQEAFYRRGVLKVFGIEARFRFVYQETNAPHAMSVIALDPMSKTFADRRVRSAMEKFAACLKSGVWPGYTTETCYAELPVWLEKQTEEKELNELHITSGR